MTLEADMAKEIVELQQRIRVLDKIIVTLIDNAPVEHISDEKYKIGFNAIKGGPYDG